MPATPAISNADIKRNKAKTKNITASIPCFVWLFNLDSGFVFAYFLKRFFEGNKSGSISLELIAVFSQAFKF